MRHILKYIFFLRTVLCIPGCTLLLARPALCMQSESVQDEAEARRLKPHDSQPFIQSIKTIACSPLTRCVIERSLLCALEAWSAPEFFVPLGVAALVSVDLGYGQCIPKASVLREFSENVRKTPVNALGKFALSVGFKGIVHHRFFSPVSDVVSDVVSDGKESFSSVFHEERGLVPFKPCIPKDISMPRSVCGLYDVHPVLHGPLSRLYVFALLPPLSSLFQEEITLVYQGISIIQVLEAKPLAVQYTNDFTEKPSVKRNGLIQNFHSVASHFKRAVSYVASQIMSCIQYVVCRLISCREEDQ